MSRKTVSTTEARSTGSEQTRAAGPEGGLADVAGGWEGSGELARILDSSPRVGRREIGLLD